MGNLQTDVDAKEQFMSPMVTLLKEGVEKVKKYVNHLIDVHITITAPTGKCNTCVHVHVHVRSVR